MSPAGSAFADAPESRVQAETWTRVKNHAVRFGLCQGCASQLAWGHQLGFERVTRPPCTACVPVIDRLDVAKANGWRTVAGCAAKVAVWPIARVQDGSGVFGPRTSGDHPSTPLGSARGPYNATCVVGAP